MAGKDTKQFPSFYQNLINFVCDQPEPLAIVYHLARLVAVVAQADVEYFDSEIHIGGYRADDTLSENVFTSIIRSSWREALLTRARSQGSNPWQT